MHLLLLALAVGIFVHDYEDVAGGGAGAGGVAPLLGGWWLAAAVIGGKVVLAGAYAAACGVALRGLGKRGGMKRLRWVDRATGVLPYAALGLYAVDLWLGWLWWLRDVLGDPIFVDEFLAMAPTLAVLVAAWWSYYPIDRRVREASLIARIDSGGPVYPVWTRSQYMLAQLRHQVAIVFLPLVLVMAWSEFAQQEWLAEWFGAGFDPRPLLIVAGCVTVFLAAPVMMRHVWDTAPLPEGELRQRLVGLCRRHGVRVRELLLWRTFGGLINAAVMGLAPPVRYILLTDALLDTLGRREVEAVMAHELGHVKKRHMFWLLGAAVASLGLLEYAVNAVVEAAPAVDPEDTTGVVGMAAEWLTGRDALWGLGMLTAGAGWVLVFGWVSRRIERQADAFAVQSLATERAMEGGEEQWAGPAVIDAESVGAMVSALQRVADLNHIPVRRRSWRHGSIAWRQDYLRTLVGRRVDEVSIDRQMGLIRLATLLGLAALVACSVATPAGSGFF